MARNKYTPDEIIRMCAQVVRLASRLSRGGCGRVTALLRAECFRLLVLVQAVALIGG